jgi:hypothetical protein
MTTLWMKLKRMLIIIGGAFSMLLGSGGIIGIVLFQKPEMKSAYMYIGLYGSEKQIGDLS